LLGTPCFFLKKEKENVLALVIAIIWMGWDNGRSEKTLMVENWNKVNGSV
jgi:hypothetical protein